MKLPTTISACHALILEQQKLVSSLTARAEELEKRLSELEGKRSKNSKNSDKPPSSDGYGKRPAFPRSKGKKRGGQKGHKGKTLEIQADRSKIDEVIPLLPPTCEDCGTALDPIQAKVAEVRQEFDLPEPKLLIREYQRLETSCACCGKKNTGTFPDAIKASTQYGAGVKSLTVLLNSGFSLPVKKVQALFETLFGYAINENTIVSNTQRCAALLEESEQEIKQKLQESELGHSDETGIRVAGKLHWLHVFANELYSFFFVHEKRGKKALQDACSVLPGYSGWVVHDCWSSYFKFEGVKHALCGAHILRELYALEEKGVIWAKWFQHYLLTVLDMVEQNDGVLPVEQREKAMELFLCIWESADQLEPLPEKPKGKRGRAKATEGRNLLTRLINYHEAVLAFAFHQEVPFTNNLAERALRPIKTKQKVAGCFRTRSGADNHARIFGFLDTLRKQNLNVFDQLKRVFQGQSHAFSLRGW